MHPPELQNQYNPYVAAVDEHHQDAASLCVTEELVAL
jgi:hypothetical protein